LPKFETAPVVTWENRNNKVNKVQSARISVDNPNLIVNVINKESINNIEATTNNKTNTKKLNKTNTTNYDAVTKQVINEKVKTSKTKKNKRKLVSLYVESESEKDENLDDHTKTQISDEYNVEPRNDDKDTERSGNENEELTDFEDCDESGWYKKQSKFDVENFGNAAVYVGRTFKLIPKYEKEVCFDSKALSHGKIFSVVCKRNNNNNSEPKLYFKCYNHQTHITVPTSPKDLYYILCANLMSLIDSVRKVEFDALNDTKLFFRDSLIGRRISKPFPKNSNSVFYSGYIKKYNKRSKLYKVHYPQDDDEEELDEEEVLKYLKQ